VSNQSDGAGYVIGSAGDVRGGADDFIDGADDVIGSTGDIIGGTSDVIGVGGAAPVVRTKSLLMSLLGVFWPSLARAAAYKLAADLLRYVPPLLLARLLSRMHTCGPLEAYSLAVGLPLTTLAQALLVNQYFWHALRTGVQVRGVLTAAILRRALAYRRCERADGGRLANMISSDCGRLNAACGSLNMVWSAPLQLCLALLQPLRHLIILPVSVLCLGPDPQGTKDV
jgi:hypothetical protein